LEYFPIEVKRSQGVATDNQLSLSDRAASASQTCHFTLYSMRKIRLFLTQYANRLLVKTIVISLLDNCRADLAGLPACILKPLQMVHDAETRLVFDHPKMTHVTPLLIELHWLPMGARIKFSSPMLAYRVTVGLTSSYLNYLLLDLCIPLRNAVWYFHPTAQQFSQHITKLLQLSF